MKKEKRQALPSRRKRTLRRILVAAAALFLVNRIFLMSLLFPIQAIRQNEEREGTGRTAVVRRERAPEIHKSHLIYLTENENVTMLSGAYLTHLGWMNAFSVAVDCTEPGTIHGGWWIITKEEAPTLFYVFGRIDDPNIVRLDILAQYEIWTLSGIPLRRNAFTWSTSREEWLEKDGRCYFLFRKYPLDESGYSTRLPPVAVGYDADGKEIARVELEQGSSSYFG